MMIILDTPTKEILETAEAAHEGRFFNPEDAGIETQPDTETLTALELARAARLAMEARQAEQRFYNQGLQDWMAMHRDTEAAKYYFDYWKDRR